jgi:phosphoglycerate dehydrogenase-like enzyme
LRNRAIPQNVRLSEQELAAKVRDYDAIIVGVEKISAPVIQAASKLRVIAKHGAGVDNIDIKAATARKIAVFSASGANSDAVADLTIGLFISMARKGGKDGERVRLARVGQESNRVSDEGIRGSIDRKDSFRL